MLSYSSQPRPFLKWAGGKTQLIAQLTGHLPPDLQHRKIRRYVEPFIGGGAMFFHVACTYPVEELVICDVHEELILCYATIRHDVAAVMALLDELHARYMAAPEEERKRMFYAIRQQFNDAHAHIDRTTFNQGWVERTAQMIFLNRTCFNGLFRFNARGHFNVSFGGYKKPRFYDAANLRTAASILQHTTILCGDFTVCQQYADEHSFFYLDPPYRPLSKTAGFTSYARFKFDDADQQRLARFFAELDALGAKLMLSNSDPKNVNPDDDFFERLYARYKTATVQASRAINSDSKKRGKISELVITNYMHSQTCST